MSESSRKNFRSLSELHYKKVFTTLPASKFPITIMQTTLEHVALYDIVSHLHATSFKNLINKLDLFLKKDNKESSAYTKALQTLKKHFSKDESDGCTDPQCKQGPRDSFKEPDITELNEEKALKILDISSAELNSTLRALIKSTSSSSKKQKNSSSTLNAQLVKGWFEVYVRGMLNWKNGGVRERSKLLCNVIEKLENEYNSCDQWKAS